MSFDLKDLEFGTLNNFQDAFAGSGSRRRTNSGEFINQTLKRTFGRDSLHSVQEFNGIVVARRQLTRALYQKKGPFIMSAAEQNAPATTSESTDDPETRTASKMVFVYKVYIPELECRPAPCGQDDPVIPTYKDVVPSTEVESVYGDIPVGGIVRVRYSDLANMLDPEIIDYQGSVQMDNYDTSVSAIAGYHSGASTTSSPLACPEAMQKRAIEVPKKRLKGKFKWSDLKKMKVPLQSLLDYIATGEGHVESVNRGGAGDSKKDASHYITKGPLQGRTLVSMTIDEVQSLQKGYWQYVPKPKTKTKGGKNKGDVNMVGSDYASNPGFLAVGTMQFIPSTLKGCVSATGLPGSTKFTKETQMTLGAYLCLGGQGSALGTYLVGLHDNVGAAAQNLAEIWASIPLQFASGKCGVGYSKYCTGGANSPDPLTKKPCEVVAKLKVARDAIAASSTAVAILESKKIKSATA
tara:strand:- start:10816 stop:12213 length:1398 start_codon:yes stop_codon:yes gene_type:complete